MNAIPNNFEFNWHALLLGIATMMACLTIQAVAVVFAMEKTKSPIYKFASQNKRIRAYLYFYLAILILLMGHLLQILAWGSSLYLFNIVSNPHIAFTLAGSTYTTVGFISDPLAWNWQIIMIIMATSGLFSFAWSTSIMFSLTRRLYPIEI